MGTNSRHGNSGSVGTWSYEYDARNQLIAQTDARGVKTGMTYDKAGRLKERRVLSPVVADPVLVTNTYDEPWTGYYNIGKLTTSANSNRTERYFYNAGGQLANHQQVDPGQPVHWRINAVSADGNILYKRYSGGPNIGLNPDGSANYWQYDAFGRLESVPGIITAQTYETDGQTKFIQYANGVTTAFTYSPKRRWLTRIVTKNAGWGLADRQQLFEGRRRPHPVDQRPYAV